MKLSRRHGSNIKLLRKVEDIDFDVFVYKTNILTGSDLFLV